MQNHDLESPGWAYLERASIPGSKRMITSRPNNYIWQGGNTDARYNYIEN